MRRLGLKDNVALLTVLLPLTNGLLLQNGAGSSSQRMNQSGRHVPALLVGNTHLLFNPRRGDIKVIPLLVPASAYTFCQVYLKHLVKEFLRDVTCDQPTIALASASATAVELWVSSLSPTFGLRDVYSALYDDGIIR